MEYQSKNRKKGKENCSKGEKDVQSLTTPIPMTHIEAKNIKLTLEDAIPALIIKISQILY